MQLKTNSKSRLKQRWVQISRNKLTNSMKLQKQLLKELKEHPSRLLFNWEQVANTIQLRKSSQLKVEMPLISSILLEKCGSLISGQLGVHHAKHQWHTIRQCLIKEELIGATKLRSFASVLIKLPRLLLSMLRLRDGRSQFTITELNLIAVHNTQ